MSAVIDSATANGVGFLAADQLLDWFANLEKTRPFQHGSNGRVPVVWVGNCG